MDLFEHQGKELFARWGIPIPEGRVAASPSEAAAAAAALGGRVAVKAQVQAGGRGKAGGVKVVEDPASAGEAASAILGLTIGGRPVERVLVERAVALRAEFYAAITLDRAAGAPLLMVSSQGGVDIEEVGASDPEAIARVHADPLLGLREFQVRKLVFEAGLPAAARAGAGALLATLYRLFVGIDASLVEVNPLGLTDAGEVLALDAKVTIDDSALFRHPELEALGATAPSDPREAMARRRGLNYIALDGDVGIVGNGAGLVMSTLDLVDQAGGRAANFLDVGGGAGAGVLSSALEVITAHPGVRSVLVNIFGGITRCDEVARGILDALGRLDVGVPIVVRLDGTNAEEGRRLLAEARHPNLRTAETMLEAAREAVEAAT